MKQRRIIKQSFKVFMSIICLLAMITSTSMSTLAAPMQYMYVSYTPKFHSNDGCLNYIEQHGIESYVTMNTLNLEQFLIDNPDLVAASITEREAVWNWIITWDSISPRKIHSMDEYEEYYCRARNLCIDLGVYGPISTLSVKEKCKAIHDEVCHRCDYDFSYSRYSYEELMDDNIGVCNAFATYGMMMFTIAGIENGYVEGPNHIWNAVLAEDGVWYQIDLCWDACYGYSMDYFWMYERCHVNAPNISISGSYMIPTAQDSYILQDLK